MSWVVVITGASSGIGRATAHAFARCGASVVLAARDREALEETSRECVRLGSPATLPFALDVTDQAAVESLADAVIAGFGRMDVWVNNAGVVLFGRFDQLEPDAFRRVLETNFFGYVHGARAAIPRFRAQGRGVLINNASVLGIIGMPYASAYVASKFAIRGLSECLRQELRDCPDIHVCTVLTATIDTAIFQRGGNVSGWRPRAIEPVYDPKTAARVILRLARWPRREVAAGGFARWIGLGRALAPALTERIAAWFGHMLQFDRRHSVAHSDGNLFAPMHDAQDLNGGWRSRPAHSLALGVAGLLLGSAAALAVRPLFALLCTTGARRVKRGR